MDRVQVRIVQQDGCELRVTMPVNDYDCLIERWLELCFSDHGGPIEIPAPPPPGEKSPVLVPMPAGEIRSIEALAL
jgi:hypothetical protein